MENSYHNNQEIGQTSGKKAHLGSNVTKMIVIFATFCFIAALFFYFQLHSYFALGPVGIYELSIRQSSPELAHAEFAMSMEKKDVTESHRQAHLFGEALFNVIGFNGISTCDDRFSYGCLHEVVSKSLYEFGLEALYKLDSACSVLEFDKRSECEHGIGHGLLAYYGYNYDGLNKSLEGCDSLSNPYPDVVGGCNGGVFMEFNLQAMKGTGVVARGVIDDDFFYPCNLFTEKHRTACVYKLPQWWQLLMIKDGEPIEQTYKKISSKCAAVVRNQNDRIVCLSGIGVLAVGDGDRDPSETARLCGITKTVKDAEYACLVNAAYRFRMIDKSKSHLLCESLVAYQRKACLSAAQSKPIKLFP